MTETKEATDTTEQTDEADEADETAQESTDAQDNAQGVEADVEQAEAAEPEAKDDAPKSDDLKIIITVGSQRSFIGVQRASTDAHIEMFTTTDLKVLADGITPVVERAMQVWRDSAKYPAYVRPGGTKKRKTTTTSTATPKPDAEKKDEEEVEQPALL